MAGRYGLRGAVGSRRVYVVLAVILLVSLGVVVFFHYFPAGVIGELAAVPAIAALFGSILRLGRDFIAHERTLAVEEHRNRFAGPAQNSVGRSARRVAAKISEELAKICCADFNVAFIRVKRSRCRVGLIIPPAVNGATTFVRAEWTLWPRPH
jgi:hypothetical protein